MGVGLVWSLAANGALAAARMCRRPPSIPAEIANNTAIRSVKRMTFVPLGVCCWCKRESLFLGDEENWRSTG